MIRAWPLVLFGVGAGCVDLKAAYPDRHFYTIAAVRAGPGRSGDPRDVLRLRRFTASKMCDGTEFVRRVGDSEYESDFYNVLLVPPALLVGEQSQRWLSGSGLFGHVVGAGSLVSETYLLEGNVVTLHGDHRDPDAPRAVIELQFMLLRVASDPPAVLLERTYRKELPLPSGGPASLVRGWSQGLEEILAALEEDLEKARRGKESPTQVK